MSTPKRPWGPVPIFAAIFCVGLTISPIADTHAQPAAGAEVAQTPTSTQRSAPATDTFGQTQFVLSGDPIVPPRDYSRGTQMPREQDYDPQESGTIYDVAFMGIEGNEMQFEVRGYSIADLDHPDSGQTLSFPIEQKTIIIRDLTIEIDEVTPGSLTYSVQVS